MTPLWKTCRLGLNQRLTIGPAVAGLTGSPLMRSEIDGRVENLNRQDVETLRDLCEAALA